MAEAKKRERRLALVAAAEGVEPRGAGSPCAEAERFLFSVKCTARGVRGGGRAGKNKNN